MIAGGVESMSRAPFVMPKADSAFARGPQIFDTTIGWRFINPVMKAMYGVDAMPETAENVAFDYKISREDQDKFAQASQERAAAAQVVHGCRQKVKGRLPQQRAAVGQPHRAARQRVKQPRAHVALPPDGQQQARGVLVRQRGQPKLVVEKLAGKLR